MMTMTVRTTLSSGTKRGNKSYHAAGEYMDYDSDYETREDTDKGIADVDPYSGNLLIKCGVECHLN